jgi:hypothetical protein
MNELDVRKPLVVSISQRSKELREPGLELDNFKHRLKSGMDQTVHFLGVMIGVF